MADFDQAFFKHAISTIMNGVKRIQYKTDIVWRVKIIIIVFENVKKGKNF